MKIRSRVSTGDEWPGGSAVFQTTFVLGPNSTGKPVDAETPLPFGPRNCDQSSAAALVNESVATSSAQDMAKIVFFTFKVRAAFLVTILTRGLGSDAILIECR
jgi:hypothetical protein